MQRSTDWSAFYFPGLPGPNRPDRAHQSQPERARAEPGNTP
ncbi:hypothetical protein [Ruegeria profundi]|nr:hypothetical protein [Ruegeria profundi]